ncbi:hypothetical protein L0P85_07030 [Terrisporobacter glycolicus]|nr:hypothetical protein L0P85_07030 [Terrisporobacter glycolicus]
MEKGIETLASYERRLIRSEYVHGMRYSKMEGKMNYSIRYLKRMHAQILDKIMNI